MKKKKTTSMSWELSGSRPQAPVINVLPRNMEEIEIPDEYLIYYDDNEGPRVGEIKIQPWRFELWDPDDIDDNNEGYQVSEYAAGFLGFATSGGGEMFAFDENHKIYVLPFIGMSPKEAIPVAESWSKFITLMK